MLDYFLDWGEAKCAELLCKGFDSSISRCASTSNTGAVLDIQGQGTISRITVWNSGDIYLETLDIETEATIYSKSLHLSSPFPFDEEFKDFFAALK